MEADQRPPPRAAAPTPRTASSWCPGAGRSSRWSSAGPRSTAACDSRCCCCSHAGLAGPKRTRGAPKRTPAPKRPRRFGGRSRLLRRKEGRGLRSSMRHRTRCATPRARILGTDFARRFARYPSTPFQRDENNDDKNRNKDRKKKEAKKNRNRNKNK
eukprot:3518377-Rhodomonas_salina.1